MVDRFFPNEDKLEEDTKYLFMDLYISEEAPYFTSTATAAYIVAQLVHVL